MIGFLGFGLSYAQQDEIENLLDNGGFENGTTNPWKVGGGIRDNGGIGATLEVVDTLKGTKVPKEPIEGNLCLHVDVPKAGASISDVQIMVANHPPVYEKGEIYTFSAFITSDDNMQFQLNIGAGSEDSFKPNFKSETFIMTEEWIEYYLTTSPFSKQPVSTRAKFFVGSNKGEFWIDDIKIYKGEYIPSVPKQAIQPIGKLATTWARIKAD